MLLPCCLRARTMQRIMVRLEALSLHLLSVTLFAVPVCVVFQTDTCATASLPLYVSMSHRRMSSALVEAMPSPTSPGSNDARALRLQYNGRFVTCCTLLHLPAQRRSGRRRLSAIGHGADETWRLPLAVAPMCPDEDGCATRYRTVQTRPPVFDSQRRGRG